MVLHCKELTKTFTPRTYVRIRVMRRNGIYHVRWAASRRDASRWPSAHLSYAQQPKPPCKKCRARSSVMRTTPNFTRVSPLHAGEVGAPFQGNRRYSEVDKRTPSRMFPCACTRDESRQHARASQRRRLYAGDATRVPRVLRASAALVQVTARPGGACPGSFPNTSYTSPIRIRRACLFCSSINPTYFPAELAVAAISKSEKFR